MRILLDENLDPDLAPLFTGHEVTAVAGSGMRGLSDKELLHIANERYEVFVTLDKSFIHQQNLRNTVLVIVLLRARNNRYETLVPAVPLVLEFLTDVVPGAIGIIAVP